MSDDAEAAPEPQVRPTLRARDTRGLIRFLVDAFGFEATAAGADVIFGLSDTDYGSHDFAVRDPEGNHWPFGTYRGGPGRWPQPAFDLEQCGAVVVVSPACCSRSTRTGGVSGMRQPARWCNARLAAFSGKMPA